MCRGLLPRSLVRELRPCMPCGQNISYIYVYMESPTHLIFYSSLKRLRHHKSPRAPGDSSILPSPAIISVPGWLHVTHGFPCQLNKGFESPRYRWGYPKHHPHVFQKWEPHWHHKWAALGPALGWSGIRREPEPLLHRKTKLAILHQCQVARSLIRAGSSPSSSQATEVCCSFLCINSSPSDPPPKGWHFYSCFSGKASLPFLKQHVQKLQATAFSDCLLLPGKWGV